MAIKELPETLRVAFLLIIFGTILLVLEYCMAIGVKNKTSANGNKVNRR